MKTILLLSSLLLISLLPAASQLTPKGPSTPLLLAKDGHTPYTIVYAEGSPATKSAAQELRAYLRILSSGVTFPLVSEKETFKTPFISVGPTAAARKAGVGAALPAGRTATEIKVIDGNIYLYGIPEAFPAVMNFLEGDLGCRYYTDKISHLPVTPELKADVTDRVEIASFDDRLVLTDYDLAMSYAWTRRNNVLRWEHFRHPRDWFAHTYRLIVPMKDFAKTPELFAVVDGKPSNTMICPTHPENIRRFKEGVRQAMAANPDKRYFSVSESDGSYPYCHCPRCMKIIKAHGGAPIAAHLYLVNEVAKSVADRAPGQLVECFVYSRDFRQPPVNLKLEPNVNIWYCSTGDAIKPEFAKPGRAKEFEAWRKMVSHMTIWDYTADYGNYFHILPALTAEVQNLKYYLRHGIDGVMIMEVYGCRGGDQQRLRAWVLAKLLWNAKLDANELAREYCEGVYGPAAGERYAYFELVDKAGQAGKSIKEFYGLEKFTAEADKLFRAALPKVADNPAALRELELDYLPILITRLNLIFDAYPGNKAHFPTAEYRQLLAEIKRISSAYGVTRISELNSMNGYINEKEMLLNLADGDGSFQIHAVNGKLYDYPTVNDPLAVGGKATRQFCDGNWIVQWLLPVRLCEPGRKYQLMAEIRIDKKSSMKGVCGGGVFNGTKKRSVFTDLIDGDKLSDTEYRFVKLGKPFIPEPGCEVYAYFNAPPTSDIGKFYVNRIRLVPVK